ncbi:MAG TPA: thioredoxin domain-containing protein, partial [Puia sp.]|nr:thioredoxin domain-containing protein [Puia sp.]
MKTFTNRLAKETSPYLLQHAHNPVDWYPWGEEALQRAKRENKPILVSIGYAACHWCHVMERESFEDKETAELMNANFINIKIDREERPDLDHIYMDAVQAITGSGGWPLNVFLTPDAKPFYGGTYFPPRAFHNRPSWKDVLIGISESFKQKENEIDVQAENLLDHLMQSNSFGKKRSDDEDDFENVFNKENLYQVFENIMKSADKEDGGFGHAPKFPQTFTIQFLLHYYYFTKNEEALRQACLSLDKMIYGGIYDQIGGGFARYSTDNKWLVPHFEKMLYDNALLIIVLSECYQITKKDLYKNAIEETIGFVKRELASPEGGFYSSLDADSEGEEGKYYVWTKKEIDEILKDESEMFYSFYDVSERGNWEGENILHIKKSASEFAEQRNIDEKELIQSIGLSKQKVLKEREKRTRPALDNKIILSWNALMNIALSKASAALGNIEYKDLAVRNMSYLLENLKGDDTHLLFHCNSNGQSKFPGFLDDYAFVVSALIQLQEITSDSAYLLKAKEFTEYVIENFSANDDIQFFYTHKKQNDIIIRKK